MLNWCYVESFYYVEKIMLCAEKISKKKNLLQQLHVDHTHGKLSRAPITEHFELVMANDFAIEFKCTVYGTVANRLDLNLIS